MPELTTPDLTTPDLTMPDLPTPDLAKRVHRPIRRARRADRGFTLVELTVVIAVIGIISVAVSSGIITVLRSGPTVSNAVAQSHDQQQLTDYFVGDARSTTAANVDYSAAAVGCPGAGDGNNLIQFTFRTLDESTWQRVNYRLIPDPVNARLDRIACAGSSATSMTPGTTTRINIADSLAPAPNDWTNLMAPAVLIPPGAAGSGTENLVTIALTRTRGTMNVTASLAQFSTVPAPETTTPTTTASLPDSTSSTATTIASTTSSSTTTSTTTTTTAPASTSTVVVAPNLACTLLGTVLDLVASVSPPAAVTDLLRNEATGALVAPYRVTAALSVSVSASVLGILSLNATLCTSVQIAYNTGNTTVVVPAAVTATCSGALCLSTSVSFFVDLPATAAEQWTLGAHSATVVDASGNEISGGVGTLTVAVDPTTTTTSSTTTTSTTSTTTTVAATTPTVPEGAALNPILASQGFSLLTEGNAALTGLQIGGGVAAGGDIRFHNYGTVASSAASTFTVSGEPTATGLLAGGRLDLAQSGQMTLSVARGFVHAGSLAGAQVLLDGLKLVVAKPGFLVQAWETPRVVVDGATQINLLNPVVRPGVFPFDTAFASLRSSAARMAVLNPTSTCASVSYPQMVQSNGAWVLNLVPDKVNVLNLTAATYNSLDNVNGTGIPNSSTHLIVNIADYGAVTLSTKYWNQFQNGRHASILFNFPNATSVNVSNAFYGTLFAPNAAVALSGIQLDGDLVAKSLTSNGGSISIARFDKAVPCIG